MINNFITFLFLTIIQVFASREIVQWSEPNNLDKIDKNECNCDIKDAPTEMILSYYQRTLNLLLKSLNQDLESSTYKGQISIDLTLDEYNFIKGFSYLDANSYNWNRLDEILTRVCTKSMSNQVADVVINWKEILMYHLYCRESLIIGGVFVCLMFVYNLLNVQIKAGTVFKYLLLYGFVIDFAFTWIGLLQEKYQSSLRAECDPKEMGTFQYIFYKFGYEDGNCKKYHWPVFPNDLWQVNPIKVFATQLGNLIQTPATAFGAAFGQLTSGILGSLSWYMYLFLPVIFIFILLLICILLSFLTKTSFGFNFFRLIEFNFGKGDREKIDDMISGKHLKTIIQSVSRPQIQEIHIIPEKHLSTKNKTILPIIEDIRTDEEDVKISSIMKKDHIMDENIDAIKEEGQKTKFSN